MLNNGRLMLVVLATLGVLIPLFASASQTTIHSDSALDFQIQQIVNRPEYRHSTFGVEVYSLDENRVLYSLNGGKLFIPGSTTKLLTVGTGLELLGTNYRFHTWIYRTGPIDPNGTIRGDLILVASGDPNLSDRIQPSGTLTFENEDHSYSDSSPDAKAIPGDPAVVIGELADQVAAHGVKEVQGRVLVDATLFPEGQKELGTNAVISPISINDNLIDLIISPGVKNGAPVRLTTSPETSYVSFVNHIVTGSVGSKPDLSIQSDVIGKNGSPLVQLNGTVPLGSRATLMTYAVPQPARFAQVLLVEALRRKEIKANISSPSDKPDFTAVRSLYNAENAMAEHVSPPFSEEVKVILKVSQNLHAAMIPFILGAVLGHRTKDPEQAGFDFEHDFLANGGLDLSDASQADGAGGAPSAYFSPDFMVHYLAFMSKQQDFSIFESALPILGRDGTLWNTQVNSPAAGRVYAKTGTYQSYNALSKGPMLNGKGLAGYITTGDGRHLAFAAYANGVALPTEDPTVPPKVVGEALGEIASAIYATPLGQSAPYDIILKNGHVLDGSGGPWYVADIGIRGDCIASIGNLSRASAHKVIDAEGLIVSPGFIDMLGQSEIAFLVDNRSLSKLSQGITTEITGEGRSVAPQNAKTLSQLTPYVDQYHLTIDWTTLDGYFQRLEHVGITLNLGTYVGAAQVREAVVGDADRAPTPVELEQMKALIAQAMKDGALGLSSALIYPPGHYASTDELIALAKVAAEHGGIYATHMRSEGATETNALDEAIRIGREAGLPVEIFHLKVAGKTRWGTMPQIVSKIQAARDEGLDIRADQYPYVAGSTALASVLPPWVAEDGVDKLLARLRDPEIRARIKAEMGADHREWENLYYDSGGGSGVVISVVFNPELQRYAGKTLSEISQIEQKSELDALFDFILADKALTGALFFIASENDLTYALKQPWTSICLDANELSLDGPLFEPHTHPRSFGAFPRFLGHYARDQQLLPLSEAVRKITSMPAQREHLTGRGLLKTGFYADITIFDPRTIIDHATYTNPTRLSEGVAYVFVNGQLEYDHGRLTGANGGRPLRGPGWHGN